MKDKNLLARSWKRLGVRGLKLWADSPLPGVLSWGLAVYWTKSKRSANAWTTLWRTQTVCPSQTVRANSLFKLENRNPTRLIQRPKWTRLRSKSDNVYSGTRTFWFFRDRSNSKSVYRSTHFHFCPTISSNLASVPISSDSDFPA